MSAGRGAVHKSTACQVEDSVDSTFAAGYPCTERGTGVSRRGQTVSGLLNNFGWALTPDSNTTGGESGDLLIPTNGSTMTVFIDSVALVAYNQCRGSVGNPVPTGQFCNDDVSNIFGNTTPQAVLTTRTSNPTRHRNLDAGRSSIGVYSFNTATLTNGLHTIAWSVTDSANRTEGIGSRFFNVLNSGADAAIGAAKATPYTGPPLGGDAELRAAPAKVLGSSLLLVAPRPSAAGNHRRRLWPHGLRPGVFMEADAHQRAGPLRGAAA